MSSQQTMLDVTRLHSTFFRFHFYFSSINMSTFIFNWHLHEQITFSRKKISSPLLCEIDVVHAYAAASFHKILSRTTSSHFILLCSHNNFIFFIHFYSSPSLIHSLTNCSYVCISLQPNLLDYKAIHGIKSVFMDTFMTFLIKNQTIGIVHKLIESVV